MTGNTRETEAIGGSIDYESWAVHTKAAELGLKPATVRLIWMLKKFNRYTRFLARKERVRL